MRRKQYNYVGALFLKGDHLLIVRELGDDDFPKLPYHLPGGRLRIKDNAELALKMTIEKKYGTPIRVISKMNPVCSINRDGSVSILHGFYAENIEKFVFPNKHFQYRYVKFEDLDKYYIDPVDCILCQKAILYAPYLLGQRRTSELTAKEKAECRVYMDCLYYFSKAIPAEELSEFSLLIRADSTIHQIRRAFRFIMELYGCDYAQYLDILSYQEKRK